MGGVDHEALATPEGLRMQMRWEQAGQLRQQTEGPLEAGQGAIVEREDETTGEVTGLLKTLVTHLGVELPGEHLFLKHSNSQWLKFGKFCPTQ